MCVCGMRGDDEKLWWEKFQKSQGERDQETKRVLLLTRKKNIKTNINTREFLIVKNY